MKDKSYLIELKCLFCDHILVADESAEYKSGDLVPCSNCNKGSDYDSLIEVAQEEGIGLAEKDLIENFKKVFGKK